VVLLQPHNNQTDDHDNDSDNDPDNDSGADALDNDWDEHLSDEDEFGDDVTYPIYENLMALKDPSSGQVDTVHRDLTTSSTMTTTTTIGDNITKYQKVIEEFCATEKSYVSRLGLISEVGSCQGLPSLINIFDT